LGRLGISGLLAKPWEALFQRRSSSACFTGESVDDFCIRLRSLSGGRLKSLARDKLPSFLIRERFNFSDELLFDTL